MRINGIIECFVVAEFNFNDCLQLNSLNSLEIYENFFDGYLMAQVL